MILTEKDRQDIIELAATKIAEMHHHSMMETLGLSIGQAAAVPISLAARITGWPDKWIRRNLEGQIISSEGILDSIQLADLRVAIEERKGARRAAGAPRKG